MLVRLKSLKNTKLRNKFTFIELGPFNLDFILYPGYNEQNYSILLNLIPIIVDNE